MSLRVQMNHWFETFLTSDMSKAKQEIFYF